MTQKEAKALVTDSSRWKEYLTDKDFRVFVFQHKNLVCYRFESRLTYTDWTERPSQGTRSGAGKDMHPRARGSASSRENRMRTQGWS